MGYYTIAVKEMANKSLLYSLPRLAVLEYGNRVYYQTTGLDCLVGAALRTGELC